jgi:hypothetical protein
MRVRELDSAQEAAKKVLHRGEVIPQRLKPGLFRSIYVRPEGRTLQKMSFPAAGLAHEGRELERAC